MMRNLNPGQNVSVYHRYVDKSLRHVYSDGSYRPRIALLYNRSIASGAEDEETTTTVRPSSFVTALAAMCSVPANVLIQIVDLGTQTPFYSEQVPTTLIASGGLFNRIFRLPSPRLVQEPGMLLTQLKNNDANELFIQVVAWVLEPNYEPMAT